MPLSKSGAPPIMFVLLVYSMNYVYTDDRRAISRLSSGDAIKNNCISSPSKSALNFSIIETFNCILY